MSSYEYEVRVAKRRAAGDWKPYEAGLNHELQPGVLGPGFSYYQAWTGFSAEQAMQVARMCNEAYRCGGEQARHDLRKVLGIK